MANTKVKAEQLEAAQTNITSLGTLTSLTVDDITINGSTISDGGDLTLDIGGDINIDADGGDINFKDGGTLFGQISNSSGLYLVSSVSDAPMYLRGNDGGSYVNALTIDFQNGGRVGIGTVSPDNLLHIKTTGSTPSIELEQDAGTSYKALIKLAGNDLEIRGSSGAMEFYNGGNNDGDSATKRMAISSGGVVLVGGVTNTNGGYQLKVGGSDNQGEIAFFSNATAADLLSYDRTNGHYNTLNIHASQTNFTQGTLKGPNGTVSAPTYGFTNDTDCGMFLSSTGYLGLTVAGTKSLEIGGGIIYTATNGKIRSAASAGSLELSGGGGEVGGQILLRGGAGDADIILKTSSGSTSATERMRITTLGNVGIGGEPSVQSTGYNSAMLHLKQAASSNAGAQIRFTNGATGHAGTDGFYISHWSDGSVYQVLQENYSIEFYMDSAAQFSMAKDYFFPRRDNAQDLGLSNKRWDDIYATNNVIQTSDENLKRDITALSDAEKAVALKIKGLMRTFRWKSSYEEKGNDARYHTGVVAQQVEALFKEEGLDVSKYAFWVKGVYYVDSEGKEIVDEYGEYIIPGTDAFKEVTDKKEAYRYSIRYEELLCFIIGAM